MTRDRFSVCECQQGQGMASRLLLGCFLVAFVMGGCSSIFTTEKDKYVCKDISMVGAEADAMSAHWGVTLLHSNGEAKRIALASDSPVWSKLRDILGTRMQPGIYVLVTCGNKSLPVGTTAVIPRAAFRHDDGEVPVMSLSDLNLEGDTVPDRSDWKRNSKLWGYAKRSFLPVVPTGARAGGQGFSPTIPFSVAYYDNKSGKLLVGYVDQSTYGQVVAAIGPTFMP